MENQDIKQVDVIIIGGGIAGLWTLNRLQQLGYQTILLENQALGCGQTIQSQGIIHGGIKYALKGKLTASAEAIADMPQLWQQCLSGQGEINLKQVHVLSKYHYLWSTGDLLAKVNQFLANKVLASHSESIAYEQYPPIFHHPKFKGRVYRVEENVLDVPSLIKALAEPYPQSIFKIDEIKLNRQQDNHIDSVSISVNKQSTMCLSAQQYIFTAGQANEQLMQGIENAPAMQRRPLHMVMVKFPEAKPLYAHCIGANASPRITITSHQAHDGQCVWYLGGLIAEDGVRRNQEQQIQAAKVELARLFPWIDFAKAQWTSFFIDRAEVLQAGHKKPDHSYMKVVGNALIAWPTKLAFAPELTCNIIQHFNEQNIQPFNKARADLPPWPTAPVAQPIWDKLLP